LFRVGHDEGMPMPIVTILTLLMAGVAPEPSGPSCNQPVCAWLEVAPAGSGRTFTAFVRSDRALSGRYELVAERSGRSGRSTSKQGGAVSATPGAVIQLSRTSLAPLGPEDTWNVVLTILDQDAVVATAKIQP
jgi:hypothetical protein